MRNVNSKMVRLHCVLLYGVIESERGSETAVM